MNLIAAVDRQWGIGHHGKLLVSIPKDKQLFREETMGRVIIMGRKTLESLPVDSHSMAEQILCCQGIGTIESRERLLSIV